MDKNTIRYAALGDSLTIGVGTFFAPGFVTRYAEAIEEASNRKVKRSVFAKNGVTTQQVLTIMSNGSVRKALLEADVITISAGGNDLKKASATYFATEDQNVFRSVIRKSIRNIALMIEQIHVIKQKANTGPYIIRLIGLYNPFPYLSFSDKWINTFNRQIERLESENVLVAEISGAFKRGGRNVLSIDGFHPNGAGYKIIANELVSLGFDPLFRKNRKTFHFPIFD